MTSEAIRVSPVRLVIEGPPARKNRKHRVFANAHTPGVGRALTAEYKEFRTRVHAAWCQLRAHGVASFGPSSVRVSIAAHWPTRRKADIDATVEPTLDALTYAGVWDDDSQVVELSVTKGYDKDRPRVEVEIRRAD